MPGVLRISFPRRLLKKQAKRAPRVLLRIPASTRCTLNVIVCGVGKASRMKWERRMLPSHGESAVSPQPRTTSEILKCAREMLETAEFGRSLMSTDPRHRVPGIRNVVVFGRAVTNVLQNLRSTEPTFDGWYAIHQENLKNNPLARYMYDLRTRILKRGEMPTGVVLGIKELDSRAIFRRFPKPAHAERFFIGDSNGGSGWHIKMPDGTTERFYVDLSVKIPGVDVDVDLRFADAPDDIRHLPAAEACRMYLDLLSEVVRDAGRTFGKKEA